MGTHTLYGKDVFFSKAAAPPQGVSAGEQVRFSVKLEAKGPAALEVTPLAMYMPAAPMPPAMMMAAPFYGGMKGGCSGFFKSASKDHAYFGFVKGFNEEKGWGHIGCEATMKIYGKDVFLLRNHISGGVISPGSLVSFKVTMGAKGPQAVDVHILPDGAVSIDGMPGKQFGGYIKSFNAEKGWGFITGDEIQESFGKDIFINKRELGGHTPEQGEPVQFHVELDNDGQPQAKNISFGASPVNPIKMKKQRIG